jgi:hypothetical protein
MLREMRHAVRRLRDDRWSTTAAVAVAALAVGLASTVFAVVYGVLVRPLPYRDADRLMLLDAETLVESLPAWRDAVPSFEQLAGSMKLGLTVRGALVDATFTQTAIVDDQFFATLGVEPMSGRLPSAGETGVIVISSRFARQMAPAGTALGRVLDVGTARAEVIGILRENVGFPADSTDIWIDARTAPAISFDRATDQRRLRLFGRLRRDVGIAAARAETERALATLEPRAQRTPGVAIVEPLKDRLLQPVRPMLIAALAGAVLVLIIACANVSTILVGRAVSRTRDFACPPPAASWALRSRSPR